VCRVKAAASMKERRIPIGFSLHAAVAVAPRATEAGTSCRYLTRPANTGGEWLAVERSARIPGQDAGVTGGSVWILANFVVYAACTLYFQ
jgi:hypothetical protein